MRKGLGGIAFALVLGLWIGTVAGRGTGTVQAQTVDNTTTRWLAASVGMGQGVDAFTLFDSQTQRLAVYRLDGDTLRLLAVRDISYDIKPREFPDRKQFPPVLKMQEIYEKFLEDEKNRPGSDGQKK